MCCNFGNEFVDLSLSNDAAMQMWDVPNRSTNAQCITRNGLLQSSRTASNHTTTFGYDVLGRQTTVQDPRHTGGSVSETHYDTNGRVDWTEDPANNRTTYAFTPGTRKTGRPR